MAAELVCALCGKHYETVLDFFRHSCANPQACSICHQPRVMSPWLLLCSTCDAGPDVKANHPSKGRKGKR